MHAKVRTQQARLYFIAPGIRNVEVMAFTPENYLILAGKDWDGISVIQSFIPSNDGLNWLETTFFRNYPGRFLPSSNGTGAKLACDGAYYLVQQGGLLHAIELFTTFHITHQCSSETPDLEYLGTQEACIVVDVKNGLDEGLEDRVKLDRTDLSRDPLSAASWHPVTAYGLSFRDMLSADGRINNSPRITAWKTRFHLPACSLHVDWRKDWVVFLLVTGTIVIWHIGAGFPTVTAQVDVFGNDILGIDLTVHGNFATVAIRARLRVEDSWVAGNTFYRFPLVRAF